MTDPRYTWKEIEEVREHLGRAILWLHEPEVAWKCIEAAWVQLNQLHEAIDEGRLEMKPNFPISESIKEWVKSRKASREDEQEG